MDPMTTTPHGQAATARRRIDAAQARFARWSQQPHAIGLEPAALDPLADAIEAADDARWVIECLGYTGSAAEKDLKVALADLWRVEDGLRRAIAAFATATEDSGVRHRAGLPAPRVERQRPLPLIAAIVRATLRPHGRVELAIECPGLGEAPGVHVQVRRRVGQAGGYAAIGITWEPRFIDSTAHECSGQAAYKVRPLRGYVRGPLSERVLVSMPRLAAATRIFC